MFYKPVTNLKRLPYIKIKKPEYRTFPHEIPSDNFDKTIIDKM